MSPSKLANLTETTLTGEGHVHPEENSEQVNPVFLEPGMPNEIETQNLSQVPRNNTPDTSTSRYRNKEVQSVQEG